MYWRMTVFVSLLSKTSSAQSTKWCHSHWNCSKFFYSCFVSVFATLTLHESASLFSMVQSLELYCEECTAKCGCGSPKSHLSLHCSLKLLVWRMERIHAARLQRWRDGWAISSSLPVAAVVREGRVTGLTSGDLAAFFFLVPKISPTKTHR